MALHVIKTETTMEVYYLIWYY